MPFMKRCKFSYCKSYFFIIHFFSSVVKYLLIFSALAADFWGAFLRAPRAGRFGRGAQKRSGKQRKSRVCKCDTSPVRAKTQKPGKKRRKRRAGKQYRTRAGKNGAEPVRANATQTLCGQTTQNPRGKNTEAVQKAAQKVCGQKTAKKRSDSSASRGKR